MAANLQKGLDRMFLYFYKNRIFMELVYAGIALINGSNLVTARTNSIGEDEVNDAYQYPGRYGDLLFMYQ